MYIYPPELTSAPHSPTPLLFSSPTMSLPLLVNGADCGPVNPLQGLTKTFDRDRGVQQVATHAALVGCALREANFVGSFWCRTGWVLEGGMCSVVPRTCSRPYIAAGLPVTVLSCRRVKSRCGPILLSEPSISCARVPSACLRSCSSQRSASTSPRADTTAAYAHVASVRCIMGN